jgi:ADP-heptose:LPS heptosyltransferase
MRAKRLELWWRALWIRALVRLMRRPAGGRPDWGARPMRVLFLRHDRAGDMILSTGVMRAIARSHPTIALDVLASPANASILRGSDFVREVVVFDKRKLSVYLATARRLRRARYDAVIDCMVTAPSVTTLLLILASGARHRVGIAGRGNDAAFTVTVPATSTPNPHMVDLLGALAPAFGAEMNTGARRPAVALSVAEREWAEEVWGERDGPRVLINVSAGTIARRWPEENYAAVMEHLSARAPRIAFRVIAAPAERERGEMVARAGGGAFVETPDIRDAFALVATTDFVFTPDTSIAHAASAFDTPCVALYLRGTSERWGLLGSNSANVEHPEATLVTLSVERVLRAVDGVWDAMPVTRGG